MDSSYLYLRGQGKKWKMVQKKWRLYAFTPLITMGEAEVKREGERERKEERPIIYLNLAPFTMKRVRGVKLWGSDTPWVKKSEGGQWFLGGWGRVESPYIFYIRALARNVSVYYDDIHSGILKTWHGFMIMMAASLTAASPLDGGANGSRSEYGACPEIDWA